jgi:lipopolysaccharide transport system ATP-binding protein
MGRSIIEVNGISKKYRLGKLGATSFREEVERFMENWRARRTGVQETAKQSNTDFWSLKDVSFDVQPGEVLGVVGKNGAGKSTLLKIISRITEPTSGEIRIRGRIASLLEVGTGFHPELSGRENVFLNGAILGMSRAEIRQKFDDIVEFAEIGQFIDTPVKRYSSGMYVRLAFAVAAHLEPEILIIDEVLAVGDAEFQAKCLGKMKEVSRSQGRTVLFVSHNMAAVKSLCHRAVWLEKGKVRQIGTAERLVVDYLNETAAKSATASSAHGLKLLGAGLYQAKDDLPMNQLIFGEDYVMRVRLGSEKPFTKAAVVIQVKNAYGDLISSICTPEEGIKPFEIRDEAEVEISLSPLRLMPGRYTLDVLVFRPNDMTRYLEGENVLNFEVHPGVIAGGMWPYQSHHGYVRIADEVKLHHENRVYQL